MGRELVECESYMQEAFWAHPLNVGGTVWNSCHVRTWGVQKGREIATIKYH